LPREKIILVFKNDDKTLRHKWIIKKGIRGSRDANKVRKLQRKWGDPVEIIGDGYVANLLRKEYESYNKDPWGYRGLSSKDVLKMGSEVTGVSSKKLKELSGKIKSKLKL